MVGLFYFYFSLQWLWVASIILMLAGIGSSHEEMNFDHSVTWRPPLGVRYVKKPVVLMNGHDYVPILFQVQTPPLDIGEHIILPELCDECDHQIKIISSDLRMELSRSKEIIHHITEAIRNILHTPVDFEKNRRQKRALFGFVGHIGKFLFGQATTGDLH